MDGRAQSGDGLLSLVHVLSVVAALRHEGVEDERRLGQRQCVDVMKLAEIERRGSFLGARRGRLGAR